MLNEKCGESWQSLFSDDQETEAKAYTAKDKYKTIDQRGNSASRVSIQRYLTEKKSSANILKDEAFQKSRKVLAAKRRLLVHNCGKGNKPHA